MWRERWTGDRDSSHFLPRRQAAGSNDRDMKKALEKAGKPVRYVEFDGLRHNGWDTEEEIRQIEEAIAFLRPVLQ